MKFERAKENDKREIIELISSTIDNAFYIYIDLIKYGLDNENIDFFVYKKNEKIVSVMMLYHAGLQVFTIDMDESILEEMRKYISANQQIKQITGNSELLQKLNLPEEKYGYIETYFVERNKFDYKRINLEKYTLKEATKEDIQKNVSFLMSDDYYKKRYNQKNMEEEMLDRFETNFGRCYYLEDKGKIIASIQTVVDTEGFAMSSLLLVDKTYRGEHIAEFMVGMITDKVIDEGKRLFGIFSSKYGMQKYLDINSLKLLSVQGKLYKKTDA
jgi:predicted GNAT family acetyltransferase